MSYENLFVQSEKNVANSNMKFIYYENVNFG